MTCQTGTKFPVSYQQERAWRARGPSSRLTCWIEILGPLDKERLRDSVRALVEGHEILRTALVCEQDSEGPFQAVQDGCDFIWEQEDLRELDTSHWDARLRQWMDTQVHDQSHREQPALRALLAKVSSDTHALLLSVPPFCADAVSMDKLVALVASGYCGKPPRAENVFQYGDFAVWQREILSQQDTAEGRRFWDAYVQRLNAQSWGRAWPSTFDTGETNRRRVWRIDADASLIFRIEALASQLGVSCSTVLLACWHVLLGRISQLQSQLISIEVAGRNYPEFENAIGPFSRWIPLQTCSEGNPEFANLATEIHRRVDEVQRWQQSFSALRDSGDAFSKAWPEIGFDYIELHGLHHCDDVTFRTVDVRGAAEDLTLQLSAKRQEKHLSLDLHFDPARLSQEIVEQWSESFLTLLTAAVRNPHMPVSRLPVLSVGQRQRMLVEWNQTEVDYPGNRCMQELIEEQAARTPDRIAVRCMDRSLTYRELSEQANQLAHWLRAKGVGPDRRVGLCVDRSIEMVVGILGILKAGGAYVPLNPEHPPLRIAQQLEGAVALVMEEKSLERTGGFRGATICLDRDREALGALPHTNPAPQTTAENLAYVLFTSGSTGTPKGVAVRHRNLVNYTWFARGLMDLESVPEGLQFAMVSTVCADVGITCIYPALTSGGCLHVIPYDVATDSARYGEYSSREKIDVLKIVPSHLAALLSADGGKAVLPRKYVIVGGERLTHDLMEKITGQNAGCEVINHYAPTETTCGSLTLRLRTFDWKNWRGACMPLGRPVANTRLYVLDAEGEPVPVGARGDLHIAGDGVSAGYVGDPQRTAERFLPDKFVPGACMYRSGDVVRYLPDGNIEFLDRVDDQVKIRGFRVEVGEVQAVLESHPAAKQGIVLARAGQNGDRRLLGWVVAKDGASITGEQVREYMKQRLPDYMVPSRIAVLSRFPLTRNGKIDRQGLPEPEDETSDSPPQTATEQMVAATWREVLGREKISREENFFEIGGHSLLATQVVARLRRQVKINIPVRTIFEHPTVARLSLALENAQQEELIAPPVKPAHRNSPLPASFAQEALWVRDQFEPRSSLYNVPRAWRLKGHLDHVAIQKSLDEIVRRHESQRTTFADCDGKPVQIIAASLHIPLATHDLRPLPENQREAALDRLVEDESLRPFDLECGPLLRANLIQVSDEDHVFLLVFHHIISDAWSAGIFFKELQTLYEAFSRGTPSPLPDVRVQYGDYAISERNWLKGNVLEKYLQFWRKELADAPPLLSLPVDRPRSKARSNRGSHEIARFAPDVARALRDFSRRQAITPFTVLMSVFQALLWSYSGQEHAVIGTDVANRNAPELEGIPGFFVNLLPIRSDVSGDLTFHDLLGRVKKTLLGAYAHQQLPFAKLVQELHPERSNSHNPIVQALLVFQNAPAAEKALGRLNVEPYPVPVTSSKFDLAVFMTDGDDLVGYWVYATDLFDRNTIVEMSRRFEMLAAILVQNADTPLRGLLARDGIERDQREKSDGDGLRTPVRQDSATHSESDFAQPDAALERKIAAIWCEVLHTDVGVHDNLFEIGGHSLIATQIAARLRSRLGLAVYVRTIFDHPTIRDLARALELGDGHAREEVPEAQIAQVPRVCASE